MERKVLEELTLIAQRMELILKEELRKASIPYDMAEARAYDVKSVGVQGDKRTYLYTGEITLKDNGKVIWDPDLLQRISTRITNEVAGINRVMYNIVTKKL